MDKEIQTLATRKIAKEDARIHAESQNEIVAAKQESAKKGFIAKGDGLLIAKLQQIARRDVTRRAHAAYEAYKEAFHAGGERLSEAILRECAAKAVPSFDRASANIKEYLRRQVGGSDEMDTLGLRIDEEVATDKHGFVNQVEIECVEARLKAKGENLGELLSMKQLPKSEDLNDDLTKILKRQYPTCVLAIDLDGFKGVNDNQGHAAGNSCLEEAVLIIGGVIIGKGKLYRTGGDEFVAMLRNATASEAAVTAHRIRTEMDTGNIGGADKVTCSVGVASSESGGLDSAAPLLKAADDAMYGSKFTGKNRVTSWPLSADIVQAVEKGREEKRRRSQAAVGN